MGEKRKGRRAYLNDFTTNLRGDYVYQGSHFHYVGETPWEKRFRKLWGLTLAMAIGLVGGGFLPAAGMQTDILFSFPQDFPFYPLFYSSSAIRSFRRVR